MLLIIDGLNFLWRAKFSFGDSSENSLIFNFFRNLKAIIEQFKPTEVLFVKEGKSNFRYDIYHEYKAKRNYDSDSNKSFHASKRKALELLTLTKVKQVYIDYLECDDTISCLVQNNDDSIVVSTDTDFIQLLQHFKLKLYNPVKKTFVTPPDYDYCRNKVLCGDKTDNIEKLLTPAKAMKLTLNDQLFNDWYVNNKEKYDLNFKLISLINEYNSKDIIEIENKTDLSLLKKEFESMDFKSLINDKYWNKFEKIMNYSY